SKKVFTFAPAIRATFIGEMRYRLSGKKIPKSLRETEKVHIFAVRKNGKASGKKNKNFFPKRLAGLEKSVTFAAAPRGAGKYRRHVHRHIGLTAN
ncbi:hypothetical protein, partial [Chitinophaga sp.]|uniref:hypothetical protein n=1 Tax=Chitinophaga sp. TaxID=1869181 RepID=UPI002BEEA6EE